MEKRDLEERIAKKHTQIEKIEKRIVKWENNKSEANFIKYYADIVSVNPKSIKTMQDIANARKEFDPQGNAEEWVNKNYIEWVNDCDKEIRYAKRDLEEAQVQLDKYNNQMAIICEKENTPKIKVLEDFLNNWKKEVREFVLDNVKYKLEYYELDKQSCEFWNDRWKYLNQGMTKDEWKEKYHEMTEKEKQVKSMIHPFTEMSFSRKTENHIDEEELDKILEKEKEAKYWNMIEKVTAITGEIEDVSNLSIGYDGNLNGIVVGNKGKAKLETIGAGGYNQNIIVNVKHGQIYHFRLLVNKIK